MKVSMKLKMFLTASFASISLATANQSVQEVADLLDATMEQSSQNIAIIEYKVVLYKDRTEDGHDAQKWQSIVQKTTKSLRVVDDGDRWAESVADILKIARSGSQDGIHGEVSVSMSDGEKSACCGEQCCCMERYKGNCPCSLRQEPCNFCDSGDCNVLDIEFEDEALIDQEDSESLSCSCHILAEKK